MVKPYEIWIQGYYHKSGGIRALHVLKNELIKRGMQATMLYENNRQENTIGIYPEIISDNPENYDCVSRWLLNTADLPNDGPIFAWESGMGDHPLLTVNIIELDLFKPNNDPRSGVAYWVGKGVKDESIIPPEAIEISRNNFHKRHELAEFISSLDYLISFDPFTAVNLESVLCGTPVIIKGEHRQMSQEQISAHGWIKYGVANNIDELERARSEVHLAYDHYQSLLPTFDERINNFVEITQNYF